MCGWHLRVNKRAPGVPWECAHASLELRTVLSPPQSLIPLYLEALANVFEVCVGVIHLPVRWHSVNNVLEL